LLWYAEPGDHLIQRDTKSIGQDHERGEPRLDTALLNFAYLGAVQTRTLGQRLLRASLIACSAQATDIGTKSLAEAR
jgi:hypothetical protein